MSLPNLRELLNSEILYAAEDDAFYYIHPVSSEPYDQTSYKINKVTGESEFMYFSDILVTDGIEQIDPNEIAY